MKKTQLLTMVCLIAAGSFLLTGCRQRENVTAVTENSNIDLTNNDGQTEIAESVSPENTVSKTGEYETQKEETSESIETQGLETDSLGNAGAETAYYIVEEQNHLKEIKVTNETGSYISEKYEYNDDLRTVTITKTDIKGITEEIVTRDFCGKMLKQEFYDEEGSLLSVDDYEETERGVRSSFYSVDYLISLMGDSAYKRLDYFDADDRILSSYWVDETGNEYLFRTWRYVNDERGNLSKKIQITYPDDVLPCEYQTLTERYTYDEKDRLLTCKEICESEDGKTVSITENSYKDFENGDYLKYTKILWGNQDMEPELEQELTVYNMGSLGIYDIYGDIEYYENGRPKQGYPYGEDTQKICDLPEKGSDAPDTGENNASGDSADTSLKEYDKDGNLIHYYETGSSTDYEVECAYENGLLIRKCKTLVYFESINVPEQIIEEYFYENGRLSYIEEADVNMDKTIDRKKYEYIYEG